MIKSTKSWFVTWYNVSTNERIAVLKEKVCSYQWNFPEDLHEKAVEELTKIFAGKKGYTIDGYVHRLDINEIKNYLES